MNLNAPLTIALSKGRIFEQTLPLLAHAGIAPLDDPETSRKLILETTNPLVKFVIIRASDVPTYVQYGAADLGVAGKDVLMEHGGEGLYEPLDLGIARCRLMVAGPPDTPEPTSRRLRIATKYVHSAERYFAAKGQQVEIIKLYGSMELAPAGRSGRSDRRPGRERQHAQGQRPGAARAYRRHQLASGRQQGVLEDEARGGDLPA